MIQFSISSEDIKKEVTTSYGASSFTLEPGWYTLRINELSQPVAKENGIVSGTITFGDVESGTSFKVPVTYQVQDDKDGWRVKQTKSLIVRLCQVTNTTNWQQLTGKQIYAYVDTRKSKGRSSEVDEFGAPIMKEYINNDFKKGPLNEVILEVPQKAEDTAQSSDFNFDFSEFNG